MIKCPVCGKEFLPAPQHVYKLAGGKRLVCSYSCELRSMREREEKKKKQRSDKQMNAIEKLKAGEKAFKGDMKAVFMKSAVSAALQTFCKQNAEFADAVMVEDKTFDGAMKAVVRAVKGNAISDLDAYRAAVSYFFPGAVVDFVMNIRMSEYEEPVTMAEPSGADSAKNMKKEEKTKRKKMLSLDLEDLF